MRTIPWLIAAVVGVLIAGCAGIASAPTQQERQALAPTGTLRVAFYIGAPASIIRGTTLDESKGVGFDLEPVMNLQREVRGFNELRKMTLPLPASRVL